MGVKSIGNYNLMEKLHTDSINGGHEASYGARSRARERAYSNNILLLLTDVN